VLAGRYTRTTLGPKYTYPKDWHDCLPFIGDGPGERGIHDPIRAAAARVGRLVYRQYGPDFGNDILQPYIAQIEDAVDKAEKGAHRSTSYIEREKRDIERSIYGEIARIVALKNRKLLKRQPMAPLYSGHSNNARSCRSQARCHH
jgi:hypothetical protein